MVKQKKNLFTNFSNLDLLDKLNVLEEVISNNFTKKSKNRNTSKLNEVNSLKLLLEIIKLKHKIKSNSNENNFLDLFNKTYINPTTSISEVITDE